MKRGQGKQKLDGLRSVDLRYLHRNGLLEPGQVSTLRWSRKNRELGGFTVTAAGNHIILDYRFQHNEATQIINLTRMECYLGGTRPFMKCPHCDRQVLLLYLGPYDFRCRHCWQLTYQSRNEGQIDLQFRRARTARRKLGASANLTIPIPPRIKGRHQSKYERLRVVAEAEKQKIYRNLEEKLNIPHNKHSS